MSVDRGGLRYEIEVVLNNLEALKTFRSELQGIKTAIKDVSLATVLNAKNSAAIAAANAKASISASNAATAQQRLAIATSNAATATTKAATASVALGTAQHRAATAHSAAAAAQNRVRTSASNAAAASSRAQTAAIAISTAQNRLAKSATDAAIAQRKLSSAILSQAAASLRAAQAHVTLQAAQAKAASAAAQQALITQVRQQQVVVAQNRAKQSAVSLAAAQFRFAQAQNIAAQRSERLSRGLGSTRQAAQRLAPPLRSAEIGANRVAFQFRRLVGILAVFAVARRAVQLFTGLIKLGTRFSANVENSAIGFAGIISSIAQVTDEQGNLLEGSKKFEASLEVSRDLVREIRNDTVRTTASFDQLLKAVQEGLAPGLAAGLNPEQIRRTAVLVSQTAKAINLPQNQLGEEIRSLFSSTASQRVTRIAQAFGVSAKELNRLTKEAREQGRLFEFIQDRLAGIAKSADLATLTLDGLIARLGNALGIASSDAGLVFFDQIKRRVQEVLNLLVEVDKQGDVITTPSALLVLSQVFTGLDAALTHIVDSFSKLSLDELTGAFHVLGRAIELVGFVLGEAIRGIVEGLAFVSAFADDLSKAFGGIDASGLENVLSLVIRIGTVLVFASLVTGGLSKAFGILHGVVSSVWKIFVLLNTSVGTLATVHLRNLLKSMQAVLAVALRFLASVIVLPALIAGIVFAFKKVVEKITGIDLTWRQFTRLMVISFNLAIEKIKFAWESMRFFAVKVFNVVVAEVKESFRDVIDGLEGAVSAVSPNSALALALRTLSTDLNVSARRNKAAVDDAGERLVKAAEDLKKADQEAIKETTDALLDKTSDAEFASQIFAALPDIFKTAIDKLKELLPSGVTEAFVAAKKRVGQLIDGDIVNSKSIDKQITDAINAAKEKAAKFGVGGVDANKQPLDEKKRQQIAERIISLEAKQQAQFQNGTRQRITALERELKIVETRRQVVSDTIANEQERVLLFKELDLRAAIANEELKRLGNAGFLDGLREGLRDANQGIDLFKLGFDTIQRAAAGLADVLASIFTEPAKAGEKFLSFVKELVNSILTEFIRIQIVKLLVGKTAAKEEAVTQVAAASTSALLLKGGGEAAAAAMITGATAAAAILAGESAISAFKGAVVSAALAGGVHKGGYITHRGVIRGYHDGGPAFPGRRPAGLHPSDTIPAYLAHGEFVQTRAAVQTYGADFMELLRRRSLDPKLIRALAKRPMALPSVRQSAGPGFALGGSVSKRGSSGRGGQVLELRATDIVNDGLSADTLRIVSPGIKRPRNVAEARNRS